MVTVNLNDVIRVLVDTFDSAGNTRTFDAGTQLVFDPASVSFSSNQWSLVDTTFGGNLRIEISAIPVASEELVDVEYRIGTGSPVVYDAWQSSGINEEAGGGVIDITGLTDGVEYVAQIRPVYPSGTGTEATSDPATPTTFVEPGVADFSHVDSLVSSDGVPGDITYVYTPDGTPLIFCIAGWGTGDTLTATTGEVGRTFGTGTNIPVISNAGTDGSSKEIVLFLDNPGTTEVEFHFALNTYGVRVDIIKAPGAVSAQTPFTRVNGSTNSNFVTVNAASESRVLYGGMKNGYDTTYPLVLTSTPVDSAVELVQGVSGENSPTGDVRSAVAVTNTVDAGDYEATYTWSGPEKATVMIGVEFVGDYGAEVVEAPATETAATSVTVDGVTFSFWDAATGGSPQAVKIVYACAPAFSIDPARDGEPVWHPMIVSDVEFWMDSDLPSQQLDKTPLTDVDGYSNRLKATAPATLWEHGMMENPANLNGQGFSEYAEYINITREHGYDGTLNVDPGATGSRIHVPVGTNTTYVKAVSDYSLGEATQEVRTFDPSGGTADEGVDTGTNIISKKAHGFGANSEIVYSSGGGTAIGGLTSGETYFLINATENTFQLSATKGGSAIDLTSVGSGTAHTVTRGPRFATITPSTDWTSKIQTYIPITILSTQPADGSFRPGIGDSAKNVWGAEANIDWTVFRSLIPTEGVPSPTQVELDRLLTPQAFLFGVRSQEDGFTVTGVGGGQSMRSMNTEHRSGSQHYSAKFGHRRNLALMMLHSDYTQSQKRISALRAIQMGIDVIGSKQGNWPGYAGAGQQLGHQQLAYTAGFALQSRTMLDLAKSIFGIELDQARFYWSASEVGVNVDLLKNKVYQKTPTTEIIGSVGWTQGIGAPDVSGSSISGLSSMVNAQYRSTSYYQRMGGIMAIMALQNGPSGTTGTLEILDGGALSSANPASGAIASLDQHAGLRAQGGAAGLPPDYSQNAIAEAVKIGRWYDAYRSTIYPTLWNEPPTEFDFGDGSRSVDPQNRLTPTTGGFDYDLNIRFSPMHLNVTRRDLRYSLDRVTWVEINNTTATGSVTGLLQGVPHYIGERRHNSEGASPWTWNAPINVDSDPGIRGLITTLGTEAAAAPANTTAPKIAYNPYPAWTNTDYPIYEDAPATLTAGIESLIAGVGYWTGGPTISFAYQWKRGGVNISGATANTYTLVLADAGTNITCEVTATTGSGSASVTTAAVAVPA